MQLNFRKNAWMWSYLGSGKNAGRELMETEMNLETCFALGIKFSKHSGYLNVQFPFKLMTKAPSFFWALIFVCVPKNALSSKQWEDAVCLEHLVAEAPLSHPCEVRWVDSCVQTPLCRWGRREVFVLAHVTAGGRWCNLTKRNKLQPYE